MTLSLSATTDRREVLNTINHFLVGGVFAKMKQVGEFKDGIPNTVDLMGRLSVPIRGSWRVRRVFFKDTTEDTPKEHVAAVVSGKHKDSAFFAFRMEKRNKSGEYEIRLLLYPVVAEPDQKAAIREIKKNKDKAVSILAVPH